ncbi:MAG: hypothetical protein JNL90_19680 [Planctomycetes bacterium]|nr:hypothetical protein [Planctomycetota bacterium]
MRTPLAALAVVIAAALLEAGPAARAAAQDASTPEEVALTVGADGRSVVREVRSAQLAAGRSSLRVLDVAPQLLPETVSLRALSQPELLRLAEQAAWFEVLDVAKALEHLAGRPVELLRFHESTVEKLEGRLLFPPVVGSPTGERRLPLYLEQGDGQIRLLDDAEVVLDALPSGDWNRMRLDWRVDCERADRYRFELLYATRGLAWRCDWLLRASVEHERGDLSVVASITNGCGQAFRGARLAVQDGTTLHPVADGATLARESTLQVVLAQLRDAPLTRTPTFALPRPDAPAEALAAAAAPAPLRERFDFASDAAARIGRALPGGAAQAIVLDAKNRPWLGASGDVAATRGTALPSFFGAPVVGVRGVAQLQAREAPGRARWQVTLESTRSEPLDVEVAVPLDEEERLLEPAGPYRRSASHAFVRTRVSGASPTTVTVVVSRS